MTADESGLPLSFTWQGQAHAVVEITRRWRVNTDWWRTPVWREHFKLITETGLLVNIYRELEQDAWYLQRLYD